MKAKNKTYLVAGLLVGLAFNALAVSDSWGGDSASAIHVILNAVIAWTTSIVLALLEYEDHDRIGPGK